MCKLLYLLTLTCLFSCQKNTDEPKLEEVIPVKTEPAPEIAPEPAPKPAPEIDVAQTETMIGQPLEKVQAACDAAEVQHREIEVDGEPRMATQDYRPDRLNFKVKAGLVTEVTKG